MCLGLLCVVLGGLLCFGLLRNRQEDQIKAQELAQVREQLELLRSRKLELEADLRMLKQEAAQQTDGKATLSLLVTDLSSSFMPLIVPDLDNTGIAAVMGLSQAQFPGGAGCITPEEFQKRLDAGWDYCLVWDGAAEFDQWYAGMRERLEDIGLTMPDVLYCAEKSYSETLEKAAHVWGINMIIHSGEENLPLVSTEFDTPWKIGSCWWSASNAENILNQAIAQRSSLAFVVYQADFSASTFTAMLSTVNSQKKADKLLIHTFAEARDYRTELSKHPVNAAYQAKVRGLEEEMRAIDQQIRALTSVKPS